MYAYLTLLDIAFQYAIYRKTVQFAFRITVLRLLGRVARGMAHTPGFKKRSKGADHNVIGSIDPDSQIICYWITGARA